MQERASTEKPVAIVTGAAGQLGSAIATRFADSYQVVALTRADLDITDHAAVMARVRAARPGVIINCAAYNDVDRAEDDAVTAFAINAMAVRSLARAADVTGAVLVHYSTDFVFDGETDRPYTEDDPVAPLSVYGQSKLVGEWMAASIPPHYVLRVESLFGGPHARSSIDKFIDAFLAGREVRAFFDREVSPSFIEDVVMATAGLLARCAPFGVYHCVNSGHDTWLGVARHVADRLGVVGPKLAAVSANDVKLRAGRPRYPVLANAKLKAAGVTMPTWQDALARYLATQ